MTEDPSEYQPCRKKRTNEETFGRRLCVNGWGVQKSLSSINQSVHLG